MLTKLANYLTQGHVAASEVDSGLALDRYKRLLVQPVGLPGTEPSRLGWKYAVKTTAAVAILAAVPTTASLLTLYNPANSGRTLVITRIGFVIMTGAAQPVTMFWFSSDPGFTVPTGTLTPTCLNRKRPVGTRTLALPAGTVVVANGTGWLPSRAAGLGTSASDDLDGGILVPETAAFHLSAASLATTNDVLVYAEWLELPGYELG